VQQAKQQQQQQPDLLGVLRVPLQRSSSCNRPGAAATEAVKFLPGSSSSQLETDAAAAKDAQKQLEVGPG
jgi:hypothetical protein